MARSKQGAAALPQGAGAAPVRRRFSRLILVWALVLGLAAIAFFWDSLTGYARIGASYAARVGCSCRFVAGRDLSDCRDDFEPGMGLVVLSENAEAKSVTARFPLISTQTATFREGEGCRLEAWED